MDSVVGTVDPYQYRWSVLDYSNIPFGSSLKSPIFHILNYRWYMQVNKGLDDEPRYLGVRLFLEGTYPTGNIKGLNPTVHVSSFIEKPRQGTTDAKNIKAHYAETFNEQHPSWGYSKFILLNSVKNYLEDDRLHICVKIREKIRWKIKYSSCHPEQVPFYVNNPSYTLMIPDITVHVSSEDTDSSNINEKTNTITIPAHKEILAASSVYLKTLIIVLEPFNRDKLFIRGVDPGLFVRVLRHCYIADAEIVDIKDAIKLADIAYRFQLNNLMIDALYYLRMRVNVDNIWDIWYISDKYNCNYTYDFCKAFVRHNCRSVLESSSWVHADKKLVLETLKIDKLPEAVDEVIFFQAVLAWRTTAITKFCHEFIDSSNEYSGQLKKDFTEYILNDSKEELEYSEKIEEKDSETNEYSNIEKTFGTTNTERLRDIEISFSEMLHCIRFSRMELVFLSDIVENIDSVMNVEGIEELLSNAYRCLAFKGKKYVPEESRQLHIN